MVQIEDLIKGGDIQRVDGGRIVLDDAAAAMLHVAVDPAPMQVSVTSRGRAAQLLVVRIGGQHSELSVDVAAGCGVDVVELLCDGAQSDVKFTQSGDSRSSLTQLTLASAASRCTVQLNGRGASTNIDMLQLLNGDQRSSAVLRIEHNSGDCTSNSTSKCVANGAAQSAFDGLIYVAPDAQHTVANQSSRNVALSNEARIKAEPQLEIYADDVMCTHGATVGQMDQEAVYYMRQRGLSEEQARKIQLEGFVGDISQRCAVESLREGLMQIVSERLESL